MFDNNIGNITTRNIPYETKLRAGFNMLHECEDDLVFPERTEIPHNPDMETLCRDEHKREVKKIYKRKKLFINKREKMEYIAKVKSLKEAKIFL